MALIPYSVSPRRTDHSRGPKPRKYSVTFIPLHLAVAKCPSSWIITMPTRSAITTTRSPAPSSTATATATATTPTSGATARHPVPGAVTALVSPPRLPGPGDRSAAPWPGEPADAGVVAPCGSRDTLPVADRGGMGALTPHAPDWPRLTPPGGGPGDRP